MKNSCTIVTGASGGIGRELTGRFSEQERRVIMACRNTRKAEEIRDDIKKRLPSAEIDIMELNLASFRSIISFAKNIAGQGYVIENLVNNAGAMSPCYDVTEEGFEMNVGVNYIGTWLLTRSLIPFMAEGGKIVNTVSVTAGYGKVEKGFVEKALVKPGKYRRLRTYGDSKLALAMFTSELSKRLSDKGIIVHAADPGVADTGMITMHKWFDPLADVLFRPLIKGADRGSLSSFNAVCSADSQGCLFREKKKLPMPEFGYGSGLWDETEKVLTDRFGVFLPLF